MTCVIRREPLPRLDTPGGKWEPHSAGDNAAGGRTRSRSSVGTQSKAPTPGTQLLLLRSRAGLQSPRGPSTREGCPVPVPVGSCAIVTDSRQPTPAAQWGACSPVSPASPAHSGAASPCRRARASVTRGALTMSPGCLHQRLRDTRSRCCEFCPESHETPSCPWTGVGRGFWTGRVSSPLWEGPLHGPKEGIRRVPADLRQASLPPGQCPWAPDARLDTPPGAGESDCRGIPGRPTIKGRGDAVGFYGCRSETVTSALNVERKRKRTQPAGRVCVCGQGGAGSESSRGNAQRGQGAAPERGTAGASRRPLTAVHPGHGLGVATFQSFQNLIKVSRIASRRRQRDQPKALGLKKQVSNLGRRGHHGPTEVTRP
ncbi:uncharacterized protein LOC123819495 [Phyllostomus hastatus]|uniref:uncharacterized protein LOC123819495 n=1 Tax=Phyllostomus hastatus TaxID=9423 RepID=UPI001E684FF8|nr:uncharacterized protein LOC123819495 [Phyllostomus hastatus]